MLPLHRHKNAEQDLLKIYQAYKRCPEGPRRKRLGVAFARVSTVLQLMEEDENIQSRLLEHNDDNEEDVNFKKWLAQHRIGNDLWRVKIWSGSRLIQYRIIYAYEKRTSINTQARFHILAIVDRNDFNYEDAGVNPLSERIINDYHSI